MGLRAILCAAATLLLLPACEEGRTAPDDPYLADLRQRLERLIPDVEREIGRELKDVELVVLPRERMAEEWIHWCRDQLARIENGPTGNDLWAEARAMAEGAAEWGVAHVDPRGRIIFPDPADEESLGRLLAGLLPRSEFSKDPRALDLILLHELIHVHQDRHLESPVFHDSVRSRADILARRAVLEGHAEYLTRRIACRLGMADLYEKCIAARTDPNPNAKEFARTELRVGAADVFFPYVQGGKFVAFAVEKLGYEEAVRRVFASPPTLDAVSRPEKYLDRSEPSRWGPTAEDLRRWLARERGEARLDVIALPMVREMAGDSAGGFREGYHLQVDVVDVSAFVLIAEDESAAREIHRAWTRTLELFPQGMARLGLVDVIQLTRNPDDWTLHYAWSPGHNRRHVVREGTLILDVACHDDSELEEGAERLARRALRFLTDAAWREAWLRGGNELLKSEDAGLRLAAVSRGRRFIPDEDWEVRWLGRFYEAKDERKDEAERRAVLVAAIEDPHPCVVTRGLFAVADMRLWEVPWPLLHLRLGHEEAAVRRAAWDLMDMHIAWDEDPKEWQAPRGEALDLVAAALDDEDVTVRAHAADCLQKLEGEPGLAEVFRKALTDEHQWVRHGALITLSVYGFAFPELLPEIVDLLDERPDVAAEALGNLGPAAGTALPRLRDLLQGPEGRAEVAAAIWKIAGDPDPLFAYVTERVGQGEPDGIAALGEMGAPARPMVPEVAKALAHDNRWVRMTAAEALGKIGGPEAKEALTRQLGVEKNPKVVEGIRAALLEIKE